MRKNPRVAIFEHRDGKPSEITKSRYYQSQDDIPERSDFSDLNLRATLDS